MTRILLVKTSSMGDIIHNLPLVHDLLHHFPDAQIDWVCEENFSEIPALHPAIHTVIPVAIRRWRKHLLCRRTWQEIRRFRQQLQATRYDYILDTQGLLKSGLIVWLAHGHKIGYSRDCVREPVASRFYDETVSVDRQIHAAERYRTLAAQALHYQPDSHINYGLQKPAEHLAWLPQHPYVVLLSATSRAEKLWPEHAWIELGRELQRRGYHCILPWGSPAEQQRCERLAQQIEAAVVAPALSLAQAASLLADARLVIGVDTGLVHLATAMHTPTIAIYTASSPERNGLYASSPAINLGGENQSPSAQQVISAAEGLL